jgi:DNA (cytosine-5)-methyltransferase 1
MLKLKKRKKKLKKLKAVDFFCSSGGVTCGFRQAGIKVLGGIDIDEACKETYQKNNRTKFLTADVSNLKKEEIGKFFGIRRNQRDLIFVGCSPCQYYSNIKTNKAKSKHTRLLLEDFQDFVEYYMPGYVFIENVPGFDTNEDSPLEQFKEFLNKKGYVFSDGIVNAKNYGVPQNRRRYILIASRVDRGIKIPPPDKRNIKTVFEAIGDHRIFPPIKSGHLDSSSFKHSTAKLSELNLKRVKKTRHNGGDRREWPNALQLDSYKKHKGHYDVYGRMHWDKPSPAITTRYISYSNGRYGHPDQDRAISIREGATLQSFPLDYKFYSNSSGSIAKMVGNAVPPELAKRIALSILKTDNH